MMSVQGCDQDRHIRSNAEGDYSMDSAPVSISKISAILQNRDVDQNRLGVVIIPQPCTPGLPEEHYPLSGREALVHASLPFTRCARVLRRNSEKIDIAILRSAKQNDSLPEARAPSPDSPRRCSSHPAFPLRMAMNGARQPLDVLTACLYTPEALPPDHRSPHLMHEEHLPPARSLARRAPWPLQYRSGRSALW